MDSAWVHPLCNYTGSDALIGRRITKGDLIEGIVLRAFEGEPAPDPGGAGQCPALAFAVRDLEQALAALQERQVQLEAESKPARGRAGSNFLTRAATGSSWPNLQSDRSMNEICGEDGRLSGFLTKL
jgi:hypothetical protein